MGIVVRVVNVVSAVKGFATGIFDRTKGAEAQWKDYNIGKFGSKCSNGKSGFCAGIAIAQRAEQAA